MEGTAIVGQIVDILISGLTEFGTGIGQALSEIVEGIFFATAEGTTTMSTFGVLIIVFAGISLAEGLGEYKSLEKTGMFEYKSERKANFNIFVTCNA